MFRRLFFAAILLSVSIWTYSSDSAIEKNVVVPFVEVSKDDDICLGSSGNAITRCALITERKNAKVRQKRFQKVVMAYSSTEKLEAVRLRAATEKFANNRGELESDASGTARGAVGIEARVEELNLFLNDLEDFERGNFPVVHTSLELEATDQELNQVYKKIFAMRPDKDNKFGLSDITLDGIRTTERSWITYRDAWIQFGRLRYKDFDPVSLKYTLTKRRIVELEDELEIIQNWP